MNNNSIIMELDQVGRDIATLIYAPGLTIADEMEARATSLASVQEARKRLESNFGDEEIEQMKQDKILELSRKNSRIDQLVLEGLSS